MKNRKRQKSRDYSGLAQSLSINLSTYLPTYLPIYHSWQRVPNHLLYGDSLLIATLPSFSEFCRTLTSPVLFCYCSKGSNLLEVSHEWQFSLVIFDTNTKANTYRAHKETNRLTHVYKYILTPPVNCT